MAAVLRPQDVTLPGEIAAWLYAPGGRDGLRRHGARPLGRARPARCPPTPSASPPPGSPCCCSTTAASAPAAASRASCWTSSASSTTGAPRSPTRAGWTVSSASGCSAPRSAAATRSSSPRASPAIAAVVAQCPMTDGLLAALMTPKLTAVKLGHVALQDQLGALAGPPPKLIKAAGRPGELAVMSSPDTVPGFESITPPDSAWVNAVAARIGLKIGALPARPPRGEIACPLLICVCEDDSLVSVEGGREGRARRAAGRARPLPDRPLRDLQRRVVRAGGVAPGGVPGAPPQVRLTMSMPRHEAVAERVDVGHAALGQDDAVRGRGRSGARRPRRGRRRPR